ncbi:hypothetical protein RJT34_22556 [Clitoria ternatea]|uniref:Uncharacterized protein n=1 Tax=Clitoria ternatea TaxID=43366 RepID=A0AAN9IKV0_CLITE
MMAFLARAIKNSALIHQLFQQKEKRKELEEAFTIKRRKIEHGTIGFGKRGLEHEEGPKAVESLERFDRVLEEFWEELIFSENFEGRLDIIPTAEDEDEDEDENVLTNQSGCLNSNVSNPTIGAGDLLYSLGAPGMPWRTERKRVVEFGEVARERELEVQLVGLEEVAGEIELEVQLGKGEEKEGERPTKGS